MLRLDESFLKDVGLSAMPGSERPLFLRHVYETLELRVGIRLGDAMSDAQLDEFGALFDSGDEEGATVWLERNFPNYKAVTAEEMETLKVEIKAMASTILDCLNVTEDSRSASEKTN